MSGIARRRAAGRAPTAAEWDALSGRLPGDWLYGVATTGVVCRPGCPARCPARENVRILPDSASARAAGYRPCLRCRPGC